MVVTNVFYFLMFASVRGELPDNGGFPQRYFPDFKWCQYVQFFSRTHGLIGDERNETKDLLILSEEKHKTSNREVTFRALRSVSSPYISGEPVAYI